MLTALGVLAASGGWYEYRWIAAADCDRLKPGAVNVGAFEVVPDQADPCYLRRPRIRPWQWADGLTEIVQSVRRS